MKYRDEARERYAAMGEEALLRLPHSGDLTEAAQELVAAELRQRGLDPAREETRDAEPATEPDGQVYGGDAGPLVILERVLDSLLEAEGIPAYTADGQQVQNNLLWAIALGGVRILVPRDWIPRAREVLAAMRAGHYALDEGAEPPRGGEAP